MDYSIESAGRATKFTVPGENQLGNIVKGLRQSLQEANSIDVQQSRGIFGIGGTIYEFSMRNFDCVVIWGSYPNGSNTLIVAVSHNLYDSYQNQYEATLSTIGSVLCRLKQTP